MMLTSRITMMLVHKVLDCVEVAIGTGQREWSVTSLVEYTCTCTSVILNDAAFVCTTVVQNKGIIHVAKPQHLIGYLL